MNQCSHPTEDNSKQYLLDAVDMYNRREPYRQSIHSSQSSNNSNIFNSNPLQSVIKEGVIRYQLKQTKSRNPLSKLCQTIMLSINSSSALSIIFYSYMCISILFILKHLKMQLMPIFQHIQDSVFRGNSDAGDELAVLKEAVKSKEELISANEERISKLEAEVEELKRTNEDMRNELEEKNKVQREMNDVIVNYEYLLEKLMQEYKTANEERELARSHLANLELAFHDLIEKYERAKTIISGYEANERSFMNHLAKFEGTVERIENKYTEFKTYAVEKLNEANKQLQKNDREYVTEVTKLKSKIIQSHVKVKDLERQVSRLSIKAGCNGLKNENSIFEPLVNNIS